MNSLQNELLNKRLLHQLVRAYCPLQHAHQLAEQLEIFFPFENLSIFSKYELHRQLNDLVLREYLGESVLKYALFKKFQKKNNIGAFEIRVGRSRADFLRINGSSSSYEIKSTLDTLHKLPKQAADYVKAFDFNYIVIDEKHLAKAKDIVPSSFGIWSFSKGIHKQHRKAAPNKAIDAEMQIGLLTKKEKSIGFKEVSGDERMILVQYSVSDINERFKQLIKKRYEFRWNFLLAHADTILPIDLQFFFNKNVLPQIIYDQKF